MCLHFRYFDGLKRIPVANTKLWEPALPRQHCSLYAEPDMSLFEHASDLYRPPPLNLSPLFCSLERSLIDGGQILVTTVDLVASTQQR